MRVVAFTAALVIAAAGSAGAYEVRPKVPGYTECYSRIDPTLFYTDLYARKTTCLSAARVARAWVRGYGRNSERLQTSPVQRVRGYNCKIQILQGDTNPYGRVDCRRQSARIRFYGYS